MKNIRTPTVVGLIKAEIEANKELPAISSADAGKLATVDSNGKWAAANLTVGQGEVAVDSTLLVTGAAADAKVTGDEINNLKSAIDEVEQALPSTSTAGNIFPVGTNTSVNLLNNTENSVTVLGVGENLLNTSAVENGYVQSDGTIKSVSWYQHTDFISCYGMAKLHLYKTVGSSSSSRAIAFYGQDKTTVVGYTTQLGDTSTAAEYTIPATAYYVRLNHDPAVTDAGYVGFNALSGTVPAYAGRTATTISAGATETVSIQNTDVYLMASEVITQKVQMDVAEELDKRVSIPASGAVGNALIVSAISNGVPTEIVCGDAACRSVTVGRFAAELHGISAGSDMTMLTEDTILSITQSTDDLSTSSGRIYYKSYANGFDEQPTATKTFRHYFGHCNTVDYNPNNDCLIFGNGSGDYTMDGKIIIVPNFSTLMAGTGHESDEDAFTLANTNAVVIDCASYDMGTKFNVLWGESSGATVDNIAYLITAIKDAEPQAGGDQGIIRRLFLGLGENELTYGTLISGAANDEFNGTFDIMATYTQDGTMYDQCNQGSAYKNGYIYAGVGHDGLWIWKMALQNGHISYDTYKQYLYDDNGDAKNKSISGICFNSQYMFVGINGKIYAIDR